MAETTQGRAGCGGDSTSYSRLIPYTRPVGPKGIRDPQSPGIAGGVNSGPGGTQGGGGRLQEGGAPGLTGGTNHGCCGSQGRY